MPWQPTWWFWLLVALVAVLLTLILAGLAALFTYYCFLRSGRQSESLTRIQLHQNSAVYAHVHFYAYSFEYSIRLSCIRVARSA